MLELEAFGLEALKVFICFLAQDYMRTLFYGFLKCVTWGLGGTRYRIIIG